MIVLTNPWVLIILPVLTGIVIIIHRRASQNKAVLEKSLMGRGANTRFKLISIVVAITLLVLALSQPIITYQEKIPIHSLKDMIKYNSKLPAQYIILVDVSPSMHRGIPQRIDTAVKVVETIIDSIKDNGTIVLSVFGGCVEQLYVGSPDNATKIIGLIKNYNIKYTAIGDAIGYAISCARASSLPSVAIIITDGANNYGPNPIQSYIYANKSRLPVLFIRIDDDPRANPLFAELARHGAYIVSAINDYSINWLKPVIINAVQHMKYLALIESGKNYVLIKRTSSLPSTALGLVGLIAIIISRIHW